MVYEHEFKVMPAMQRPLLRVAFLVVSLGAALTANALDTYSNLGSPVAYRPATPAYNLSGFIQGAQFTASLGGALTGFKVAINNSDDSTVQKPLTLRLYEDDGAGKLGALLGSYAGSTTGAWFVTETSALSTVDATGPVVALSAGWRYWLVAEVPGQTSGAWNRSTSADGRRYIQGDALEYSNSYLPAFSVQVTAVPEPASVLALGLGALALIKRRKRA